MPRNQNKKRYQGNKTVHTYPLPVLWFCGLAQLVTRVVLRSSPQAALALPNFCPPNNLMQSCNGYSFVCCFTCTVQLLHKHSFITFHLTNSNIIHRKRMFSNNMSVYFSLIWRFKKINTLTGILADIMCMRCVVHMYLDTFTAH